MPESSESIVKPIEEIFDRQIEIAKQLEHILNEEKHALTKRELEAIQTLNQEKNEYTHQLEQLSNQQSLLLKQAGLQYTAEGLGHYIETQSEKHQTILNEKQNQLHTILKECQKLNLINGNIISANKQSAEALIAILRGQVAPDNLTYSPGGHPVSDNNTKPLTKA